MERGFGKDWEAASSFSSFERGGMECWGEVRDEIWDGMGEEGKGGMGWFGGLDRVLIYWVSGKRKDGDKRRVCLWDRGKGFRGVRCGNRIEDRPVSTIRRVRNPGIMPDITPTLSTCPVGGSSELLFQPPPQLLSLRSAAILRLDQLARHGLIVGEDQPGEFVDVIVDLLELILDLILMVQIQSRLDRVDLPELRLHRDLEAEPINTRRSSIELTE